MVILVKGIRFLKETDQVMLGNVTAKRLYNSYEVT